MLSKNRYIKDPQAKFGSYVPVGSGTSADVAWSRASTWPTWAEVPEPAGASDQKSDLGASIYPFKLSFPQIYVNFCDSVVYPSVHPTTATNKIHSQPLSKSVGLIK